MIITLGGLPVTFIEKPNITDDLDSSNNTFEFTVLGSIPKIFGQIVTINTIKSGQVYKGIFIGAKINPGPPRKTTVRCIGMDYLTECKVLYGTFSGSATDVLRQLCDASGIKDILGYPVSPIDTQIELDLNGEYLRQALDLFCQNIGAYWRVTTDQGLLEIFLPDSASPAPHNITLPFHNCNNAQQLLDLDFENTPNAFSTVIVAGKNAPLEYSSVTLNTRTEDVITQLKADDENRIFELLEGATRIVYVDISPKSSGGELPLFGSIQSIAFDSDGNCYITDQGEVSSRVRKVASNILSTIAGDENYEDSGDGGPAVDASIRAYSVRSDSNGNLFIGTDSYRIRKIDTDGIISTFAGNGTEGNPPTGDGGPATDAAIYIPQDLAINSDDEVFYCSANANPLRFIDGAGIIDTVLDGLGNPIENAQYMNFDTSGTDLYLTDGNSIYKFSGGVVTTVAGTGVYGYTGDGGPAIDAEIGAFHLCLDEDGNIYFAQSVQNVIRKIDTDGNISTFAGTGTAGYSGNGGQAADAELEYPHSMAIHSGNLYFSDQIQSCIRKIDLTTGVITLFAGTPGQRGFSGDGGPATL